MANIVPHIYLIKSVPETKEHCCRLGEVFNDTAYVVCFSLGCTQ